MEIRGLGIHISISRSFLLAIYLMCMRTVVQQALYACAKL